MFVTSIGAGLVTPTGSLRDASHNEFAARAQIQAEERQAAEARPEAEREIKDLEQVVLIFNKKLRFVLDLDSNEVIVKVIDRDTDKVIKELPPEELQRVHRQLEEAIGVLFDTRV